ncbi:hypothetical protein Scep_023560 [Stephania cephalantha]|uniref:non-specific serine/threonine protein kinase n=1 Tax=Stephania cephalantha TaxID=152367 RepID=A0AAP0EXM7_9MAGN
MRVSWRMSVTLLHLLLIMFPISLPLPDHQSKRHGISTDQESLMEFKKGISVDPQNSLDNWNETVHVCEWNGVSCSPDRERVTALYLKRKYLQGTISPFFCNLSSLTQLELSENSLYGSIPTEFGSLVSLEGLSLRANQIQHEVPESFGQLTQLRFIDLSRNQLGGRLPLSLFYNCTELMYVDLSANMFIGFIPSQVGNHLTKLETFRLYLNQLSGMIPASLANSTHVIELDLEANFLTGVLPSDILKRMPVLEILYLSGNLLESNDNNTNLTPFFTSISNLTRLKELQLAGNMLGGELPAMIGMLNTNLSEIHLEDNLISGAIPPSIRNLTKVTLMNFSSNLLSGSITAELSLLPKLERLWLSNNSFHGEIPQQLGNLSHLGLLDLSRNKLSGPIPSSFGNLNQLRQLYLSDNLLSGKIPSSLGGCINLDIIDLSHNRLSGVIPAEVAGLRDIGIYFNLSNNHLTGELPVELSKMAMVRAIDLSSNNFTGEIPSNLASCEAAEMIDFSHNYLQGSIPASLGNLLNLQTLDVSHNLLSGEIPASLSKPISLLQLNLSFNNFNGSIPQGGVFDSLTLESIQGNPSLCWPSAKLQICHPKKEPREHSCKFLIFLVSSVSISSFFITLCCGLSFKMVHERLQMAKKNKVASKYDTSITTSHPRISYEEIAEATRCFEKSRLIGSGSFGHVYKGELRNGKVVAVKVLKLQAGSYTNSFDRECQVLKRIRHRNLMRIITACSLPEFKALILPFMSNGSLENHLYPQSEELDSSESDLSLIARVSICSDIAEGLAYLHHHSPVQVIHCDLKPCNILLNDDMTALVSDFGIARLVMKVEEANITSKNTTNSTANLLCGSVGYIAPDSRDQSPEVKNMWEVAIIELIELGLLCTQDAPSTRPTMIDAADDLDRLKRYLSGDTTVTFASSVGITSSTVT